MWLRVILIGLLVASGTIVGTAGPAQAAMPAFQMPFPCGEEWKASTYGGHSAIDWNAYPSDNGRTVVASAAGTASLYHESLGGYQVIIDHGDGWKTVYAHLQQNGRVSGPVTAGQTIGLVGNTGGVYPNGEVVTFSPHLHWEQIHNNVQQTTLYANGVALNPGSSADQTAPSYTSNNCGGNSQGLSAPSAITAARNADGRIELFALGTDNNIYGKSQTVVNGGFSANWYTLLAGAKDLTAVSNADGRIELLYVATDGAIYGRSQTVVNGGFGQEYTLGGNLSRLTAVSNADGRIELLAVGTDGNIYGKSQTVPNGGFNAGWYMLPAGAKDVAAVSNADGRIELLYVGSNGGIFGRSQTVINGGFGSEYTIGGNLSKVTAARNADGRIEAFAVGTDGNLFGKAQSQVNGGFNPNWYTLSAGARDVTAVSNADGRIELLYVANGGAVYGRSQTVVNGGFGQEYTLGGNFM